MAYISGAFDMGKAQTNATYAYTAWVNYTESGNTLGITEDEFKELESQYRSSLGLWKQWAEEADATEYDITEEEFYDEGHQQGVDRAEGDANYDGDKNWGSTYSTVATGGAIATTACTNAIDVGLKVGSKVMEKGMEKGADAAAAATQAAKANEACKGAWVITAPLTFAIALAYTITKPNKEAHDALMKLKDVMDNTLPQELEASLNNLATLEANVVAARENAAATAEKFDETAEGTQGEIAEYQNLKAEKNVELTEAQLEKATLEAQVLAATEIINSIQARVDAGEEVSPEELNKLTATQANVATLNSQIAALGEKIKELTATIQGINNTLLELSVTLAEEQADGAESTENDSTQIAEEQAAYDEQGKEIASKQGYLDEAASYDKQTLAMCIVESVSQAMNMASAIVASVQSIAAVISSLGCNVYAWACSAMAVSASVMSGIGVGQQIKWAVDIGKEIDSREATQEKIDTGIETYDYHLDNWNVMNEQATVFNYGISEFELEEPDLSEPEVENG